MNRTETYQFQSRDDGVQVYQFYDRAVAWEHIYDHTTHEYENGPTKFDNVYYCTTCSTVFIMPAWYTDYHIGAQGNPMKLLQKYIKCCKKPMIFIRIPGDSLTSKRLGSYKGMIFEPPGGPNIVWHISDDWINSSIVADELL